jgi:hypothetical protein
MNNNLKNNYIFLEPISVSAVLPEEYSQIVEEILEITNHSVELKEPTNNAKELKQPLGNTAISSLINFN